jgi:hypothetical protein
MKNIHELKHELKVTNVGLNILYYSTSTAFLCGYGWFWWTAFGSSPFNLFVNAFIVAFFTFIVYIGYGAMKTGKQQKIYIEEQITEIEEKQVRITSHRSK